MEYSSKITSIEGSPLLVKIAGAVEKHKKDAIGIRVSISKEAEEYTPEHEGNTYLLKWLSWSLIDQNHNELFEPYLIPVHSGLAKKQIEKDLSYHFPEHLIIVDNEIVFE